MLQLFRVELSRHGYASAMILAEDAADAFAWAKREDESLFEDNDEIDVGHPTEIGPKSTCSYDELHNTPFLTDAAMAIAERETLWDNSTCAEILAEIRRREENARLDAEAEARQAKLPLDTVG